MKRTLDLDRPNWLASLPFLAAHAVALATPILAPFAWRWLALAACVYAVRMFAITAGYHRYFAHRAYVPARARRRGGLRGAEGAALVGCAPPRPSPLLRWTARRALAAAAGVLVEPDRK